MRCKKCESENLEIIQSGPHNKLVCKNCLAFQKFLSKKDAKTFNVLRSAAPKTPYHKEIDIHPASDLTSCPECGAIMDEYVKTIDGHVTVHLMVCPGCNFSHDC